MATASVGYIALLTLTTALSSYATSLLADAGWLPGALALIVAASFVPFGILLTVLLWKPPQQRPAPTEPETA